VNILKIIKEKFWIFAAVLGPGLITAIADNDAGGVATYSLLGSKFGYSMLFLLLLITILLAITQEMGARLTIVTGKGLADLIRERYGVRIAMVIFILLFMANMGSTIANFAGLSAAFSLFSLPKFISLLFITIMIFVFIYKGNYHSNQRIFLLGAFLYLAYVMSAFLSKPDWNLALSSLVIPRGLSLSPEYVFGAIALLGTTVTPWGQFFVSSFINDKKLTLDKLHFEQIEVYFGAFITDFFSFFMIVAVAATLHTHHITINSAQDAALAITPFAGQFASILFGLGLLTASFMGAVIIPLSTAYAFAEFFGVEGSLDSPINKSRSFYILFFTQIIIAFIVVMLPHISLFKIVLYSQSINGVLLPLIIFFLIKFANSKNLMGKHINGRFYNYFAITSAVIIGFASIFVIVGALLGKI
jgi:NRAMP (natural resistance-associated macrophage protein)-like metal ion transporter